MKHKGLATATAAVLGAAAVVLLACGPAAKAAPKVVVTYLTGAAFATSAGKERALAKDAFLSAGDVVRTNSDTIIDLLSSDQVAIRLLAQSQFSVSELLKDRMRVDVSDGNILVKTGRLARGRSLEVVTPTSIASVRGTQFWGQVKKEDASGVFAVRDGSIAVKLKATGQELVVEKGNAVEIAPGAASMKSRPAAAAEIAAMQQIDEIRLEHPGLK